MNRLGRCLLGTKAACMWRQNLAGKYVVHAAIFVLPIEQRRLYAHATESSFSKAHKELSSLGAPVVASLVVAVASFAIITALAQWREQKDHQSSGRAQPPGIQEHSLAVDRALSINSSKPQESSGPDLAATKPWSLPEAEWSSLADLVRRTYGKDTAPDAEGLRKCIHRCKAELGRSTYTAWPFGISEPVDELFWIKCLLAEHFHVDLAVAKARAYLGAHARPDRAACASAIQRHFNGAVCTPCVTRNGMLVVVLRLRYFAPMEPKEAKEWFCTILDAVIAWNMWQRQLEQTGAGNRLERYVLIVDLDGAGRSNVLPVASLKKLSALAHKRYPDFMEAAYVVNVGSTLMAIWNMLRWILDERMQNKFNFLGRGDCSLREIIDNNSLPASLGGRAPEWAPPEDMSTTERLGQLADLFSVAAASQLTACYEDTTTSQATQDTTCWFPCMPRVFGKATR